MSTTNSVSHRRGLAMLELVLALPFILFLMALIVCYGIVATWRVREHSVARLAVWESRWPRTGSSDPRPTYWPATASMECSSQGNVPAMDDSSVDLPVARGPLPGATVNSDLLDPTRGLLEGSASLTRGYPLLGKMGRYTMDAQSWLIDDKWQYQTPVMGMSSNTQRRIPVLYTLAEAAASMMNGYVQSAMAIDGAPIQGQLAPLDKDPDFLYYGALFGWGGAPDFQPRFQQVCSTDRAVTDPAVQSLIDRIQGKSGEATDSQCGPNNEPCVPGAVPAGFSGISGDREGQVRGFAADAGPRRVADPAIAGQDSDPAGESGGKRSGAVGRDKLASGERRPSKPGNRWVGYRPICDISL